MARRSGGSPINIGRLGTFNVRQNVEESGILARPTHLKTGPFRQNRTLVLGLCSTGL